MHPSFPMLKYALRAIIGSNVHRTTENPCVNAWARCASFRANPTPACRRRKLLPLGVVEVGASPALEELHDPGDDRAEDRDLHELAEESAFLLRAFDVVSHGDALLPGVGLDGLEPSTSSLSGKRSNRA